MPIKILMVCLGNICRSPLAEGILRSKVNNRLVQVDSCGTGNFHIGNPPDSRSIAIAKSYGINISKHRAALLSDHDFDDYDHIFVMDQSNFDTIIRLARKPKDKIKVKLIMEVAYPDSGMEVPDPYYGGDNGFEKVYQMLTTSCNAIVAQRSLPPQQIDS